MTALDMLPGQVRADIAAGSPGLRPDLLVIPAAEAAGWRVTFRNDHWHNSAQFRKNGFAIWSTGWDWRRALEHRFRYPIATFPYTMDGLRDAMMLALRENR